MAELSNIHPEDNIEYLINYPDLVKLDLTVEDGTDMNVLSHLNKLKILIIRDRVTLPLIQGLDKLFVYADVIMPPMNTLKELTIMSSRIPDCSGMINMVHLSLPYAGLKNIDFVGNMPHLKTLDITRNPVSDLTPIGKCPQMEKLIIKRCGAFSISCLANLVNLTYLDISDNNINALINLPKLTSLFCVGNPIKKIDSNRRIILRSGCLLSYLPFLDFDGSVDDFWNMSCKDQQAFERRFKDDKIKGSIRNLYKDTKPSDSQEGIPFRTLSPWLNKDKRILLSYVNQRLNDGERISLINNARILGMVNKELLISCLYDKYPDIYYKGPSI